MVLNHVGQPLRLTELAVRKPALGQVLVSVPVRTEVETFPLAEANEAVTQLRTRRLRGAAVLMTC